MEVVIELFCASKSSLNNPNLRASCPNPGKSFCILDHGEIDGETCFWVADALTGEEGFVPDMCSAYMVVFLVHELQNGSKVAALTETSQMARARARAGREDLGLF